MRIAQIAPLHERVSPRTWTREKVLALIKSICAATLFGSPWVLELAQAPTWNLRICGYAVLTASLAALVAEADWEPRANLWLGTWVLAAPWILGFAHETGATFLHLVGGGLISLLSAAQVWSGERNPPWRFGPGAAQRAVSAPPVMTVLDQTTPQPVTAIGRRRIAARRPRFAASRADFWPLRPSRHRPGRCSQVSAGTPRLGRRTCVPVRIALENKTAQTKSSCTRNVSSLVQMSAGLSK